MFRKFLTVISLSFLLLITLNANEDEYINMTPMTNEQIIDMMIENSDLDSMRNSEGLVPIDDYISLISISKAGDPAYLLSKFILNTYAMKFYLIPNIRETNRELFEEELDRRFYAGLEELRASMDKSDLDNFCSNDQDSVIMLSGITIKKDYLDEDRKFLFSTSISASRCKDSLIGLF